MTLVDRWDSGIFGANWDSGLQWDVNIGPNLGDITPYLDLVTSEHRQKTDFITTLSTLLQPIADNMAVIASLPAKFDLDVAVGDQLDVVGLWVGVQRNLTIPIGNVYFSFNISNLGFNQGVWFTAGDPSDTVVVLPDEQMRTLIRAKIVANRWNGSLPDAYDVWDIVFSGTGFSIKIHDFDNMHMDYELTGPVPDVLTIALFENGLMNLKPLGVHIDNYIVPT